MYFPHFCHATGYEIISSNQNALTMECFYLLYNISDIGAFAGAKTKKSHYFFNEVYGFYKLSKIFTCVRNYCVWVNIWTAINKIGTNELSIKLYCR